MDLSITSFPNQALMRGLMEVAADVYDQVSFTETEP